jgi:PAS domain S-box-containing protein
MFGRRLPFMTWASLVFLCLIILISAVMFTVTYQESRSALKEATREELTSVAAVVATQINGDVFRQIEPGDEGTPAFLAIRNQLVAARNSNRHIRYIYTMKKSGDDVSFVVDGDYGIKSDAAGIGQYYPDPPPELLEGFNVTSADREFTSDKWGTFLSGYAPIFDSNGNSVGLAGVDMDATAVVARMDFLGWPMLLGIFGILALCGIGIIFFEVARHRSDKALWESEERYRRFFTTSRDCVFITSREGKWIDINPSAIALFGFVSREEMLSIPVVSIYADPDERKRHIQKISEEGFTIEYPVLLKKKDGTLFHSLITSVAIRDESGNVLGFQGTIRDVTEEIRAREALQISEAQYRTFIDSMSDMAFLKDPAGRYIVINKALQEFFGRDERDIIGKTDCDLMSPASAARCELSDEKALNEGVIVLSEEPIGERIFETRKFRVRSGNSEAGVGGFIRDITERKTAEKAVEESEEKYRTLYSEALNPIFIADLEGHYLDANAAALEFLECTSDELKCLSIKDQFRPVLPPEPGGVPAPWTGGKTVEMEYSMKGKKKILLLNIVPLLVGDSTLLYGIGQDITVRKDMESALRESEEKFRELFNSAGDAIFLYRPEGPDLKGDILEVNDRACSMLWYTRDELLRMSLPDIEDEETKNKDPEIRKRLLLERQVRFEGAFIRKNGDSIPVEVSSHQFTFRGDDAVLSIARDITERKIMAQRVKESVGQISKNMEQFAILNDEIRNPLQIISGLITLHMPEDEEKILRQVGIINELVNKMDRSYLESEKVRHFLKKHYGVETGTNKEPEK